MGLADIANIPVTPEELARWSSNHMKIHLDINRRILEKFGQNLNTYQLYPLDPQNTAAWQYQHQQMHNNQNAVLGIQGQDLLGIDFRDVKILKAWLFLHLPEHMKAAQILGL